MLKESDLDTIRAVIVLLSTFRWISPEYLMTDSSSARWNHGRLLGLLGHARGAEVHVRVEVTRLTPLVVVTSAPASAGDVTDVTPLR
jgi:hypothetical protein